MQLAVDASQKGVPHQGKYVACGRGPATSHRNRVTFSITNDDCAVKNQEVAPCNACAERKINRSRALLAAGHTSRSLFFGSMPYTALRRISVGSFSNCNLAERSFRPPGNLHKYIPDSNAMDQKGPHDVNVF